MLLPALLVCALACLAGCAARNAKQGPPWQTGEEAARVRHRLALAVAGREELRFDGLMLQSAEAERFRVVGMGGFGLTMFDLVIGPDYVRTISMLPMAARMPNAADNIAGAVRRIWFHCLPALEQGENADGPACRGIRVKGFSPGHEPSRITLEGDHYTLHILTLEEHPGQP